jgi:hypothetical protein
MNKYKYRKSNATITKYKKIIFIRDKNKIEDFERERTLGVGE